MRSVWKRSIITSTFAVVLATALFTQPAQAAARDNQPTVARPSSDRPADRIARAIRPIIRKVLKPLGDIMLPKG